MKSNCDLEKVMNIIRRILKPNSPVKMVMVVRSDLNMSKGKIASQCSHAAVTLHKVAVEKDNPYLKNWFKIGQPKIILKTNLESNLRNVYDECKKNNLNACLIYDSGKTEAECSTTLTVLGIGPNVCDDIDKLTSDYQLFIN